MGWRPPCQEPFQTILKDEDNTNSIMIDQYQGLYVCPNVDSVAYRALNRRKLLVIRGSEKLGRLIYLEDRISCGRSKSLMSSSGMTCCSSLRRFRLALHFLNLVLRVMEAHLVKRRSCSE